MFIIQVILYFPEDADQQLQGDLLYLAVEALLPGPPTGSPTVWIRAGTEVGKIQLMVQLQALDPGKGHTDADHRHYVTGPVYWQGTLGRALALTRQVGTFRRLRYLSITFGGS